MQIDSTDRIEFRAVISPDSRFAQNHENRPVAIASFAAVQRTGLCYSKLCWQSALMPKAISTCTVRLLDVDDWKYFVTGTTKTHVGYHQGVLDSGFGGDS